MNNQNLIIYQFEILYEILKELEEHLNFSIVKVTNLKTLKTHINKTKNYIVITKKNVSNINSNLVITNLPVKLSKIIEKLNVQFLKKHFNDQSNINIKNYILNINSREISLKEKKLKLTEKEVNSIIYLSKVNNPVSISELEKNVWQYHSDMETHTVETHIYRLRKKILKVFKDESFIISKKNGYQI